MTTRASGAADQAVDGGRIDAHLAAFAELSEPGPGCTRLAYSPLERAAHAVFAAHMAALGLRVRTDHAGNTLAELPGAGAGKDRGDGGDGDGGGDSRAIGTGSHLDTVPSGGGFDGIVGVVAAMEVAEVMVRQGVPHRRPWRFVAFAAEEGARFGQACNGSRMAAGLTGAADLAGFTDAGGTTMAAAMAAAGLRPDLVDASRWRPEEWSAFVELHIEQGEVLHSSGVGLGVVDVISGSTRLRVRAEGRATHSGGTPMHLRRDALVTAAECVLLGDRLARDPAHDGVRVTVGRLTVEPGSITTVPGAAEFYVDIRDTDPVRQRAAARALAADFAGAADARGVRLATETIADTAPVVLPDRVSAHARAACADLGLPHRVLPSGASHDAQQIGRIIPTALLFVPSHGGLSHVPEEFTLTPQIVAGTRALLATLRRLDGARV
ncbi:Zn-dependent hydrolase [Actinacidiphila sp. ITFR-21]|uniref:Zn-dependent hydrolase n=1 Tax=Actinacidiphila sp. ITFR-21 TaxID=3075199 RepID=UPI00288A81AC|nr:Zn-dependent hydrolase [Streptomyces sp. ITFR-21]WNI18795.1 Zn-dependent hydrolase [Streptomyces sp. ITFR-21]